MEKKEEKIQVIAQGTYGCMFRPNKECKTQKIGSPDFVSKVQKVDNVSQNEIEIGKKLPNTERFAGILETCRVTVGEIGENGIQKCKMLKKDDKLNLTSSKVRYVGKKTISIFLQELLVEKNKPDKYITELINGHLYLLQSLIKLNTAGVLHLDIKYNNIIMKEEEETPVIIDFGLSYDKTYLPIDKYRTRKSLKPFGIAVDYYIPWCFEIILLSHVSRYISVSDKNNNIKILIDSEKERKPINDKEFNILQELVSKYIDEHTILKMRIFTSEEKEAFKTKMMKWISGFKLKSWRDVWNIIIKSENSWDNYGLSVMYLMELDISRLLKV